MNELSVIKASEFGLEQKQVSDVDLAFEAKAKECEVLTEVYGELIKKDITSEVAQEARDFRLKAVKIKTGIAAIHKTQKEYALAFGKYCDAWKRKETEPVQQMIDGAMEIEKFEELQEQKRLEELQLKRVELLSKYVDDASERSLSSMEDDVWSAYLSTKKKEYEDEQERVRLEEELRINNEKLDKLEQKRKLFAQGYKEFWKESEYDFRDMCEDEFQAMIVNWKKSKQDYDKEQEKIRKENERLKKEKQAELKKQETERKKLEKELLQKKEERRLNAIQFLFDHGFENTHGGMNLKSQSHFIGANHYSQLESEKEFDSFCSGVVKSIENFNANKAKDDALNKLKAKADAELKAEQERKQSEKEARLAPDKEKILNIAKELSALKLPELKSDESKDVLNQIKEQLNNTYKFIVSASKNL